MTLYLKKYEGFLHKTILPAHILLSFYLSGCTINQYTNEMAGTWVVEEFRLDGKDLVWDQLKVNMATFKQDGNCGLPVRDLSLSDKANWRVIK